MALSLDDVKPIITDLTYPSSPIQHNHTHALPTPPFSPPQTLTDVPPETSVVLINSLVSFYQQESLWVHRTRAALELALAAAPAHPHDPSSSHPPPASYASDGTLSLSDLSVADDQSIRPELGSPPPQGKVHPDSRWLQRKKSFKLKIEGMPPHTLQRRRRSRRPAEPQAPPSASETGTRLLELFGQLMESRMESCHRVSRLVREANRADLYTS
ncbi:hypothetical protein FA95DRAFT_1561268 [Auriscalpium vulgare]|uniref:Uncharacterized protein n=1 Tax=Auriscalpium vulgare TaxID=40419 RepID=A0ACB8RN83_9AGAM|nr:hypothetical protein FA95DRAFT_1561268 [Auriscalpium vulgare]